MNKRGLMYSKKKKYNNSSCQGYDSRMERDDGLYLKSLLQQGLIKSVEEQVEFVLYGPDGSRICRHKPDFLVTLLDDRQKIVETKGFATDVWVLKRKLFISNYPEIPYLTSTKINPIWLREKELLS